MLSFSKRIRRQSVRTILYHMKEEFMSKLDDLKADLADYVAKVAEDHDALKAQIESLKGQPAGVSDADLQSVIDAIDAAKAVVAPAVVAPVEAPVEVAPEAPAPVEAPAEAPAETPAQ